MIIIALLFQFAVKYRFLILKHPDTYYVVLIKQIPQY